MKFIEFITLRKNGLNVIITINTTITSDVNDKKQHLTETLDNFSVRKRIREESGVDAIFYRRRKTMSKLYGDH